MTGGSHGKGGTQIVRSVGDHRGQRQLRAGEHHRNVDIRQHKGQSGGSISHGVGAVGDHHAVAAVPQLIDHLGDLLPFLRTDVGGIQTHHILHSDVVISSQLLQLPFHHTAAMGFQTVTAGHGGNGTSGGQQHYFFVHCTHHFYQYRFLFLHYTEFQENSNRNVWIPLAFFIYSV